MGRPGRGPGRRPGSPDTRGAILAAARSAFAARGFDGTSTRAVAAAAGVAPGLVHHFFGSKDDLFVAALNLPFDPRKVLGAALPGPPEGLGRRVATTVVGLWEDEALWMIGNYKTDSFPKRIGRDPRCAVGIVDFDVSTGMVQHVGFRGRARLVWIGGGSIKGGMVSSHHYGYHYRPVSALPEPAPYPLRPRT